MKILIIEDDFLIAEELIAQLEDFGYSIAGHAADSDTALSLFEIGHPDLVLMDIELAGSKLDGIELAQIFNQKRVIPIIYLSSHAELDTVKRAAMTHPMGYISKLSPPGQLKIAIDLAFSQFFQRELEKKRTGTNEGNPECFFVKDNTTTIRIDLNELVWVEASGASIIIHTESKKIMFSVNLSGFLRQIQHRWLLRTHHSYVVNFLFIDSYDTNNVYVQSKNKNEDIPLSKTYKDSFLNSITRLKAD